MVQAGPVNVPLEERSWNFPSFRLVGFGLSDGLPVNQDDEFWENFDDVFCEDDYETTLRALGIPLPV